VKLKLKSINELLNIIGLCIVITIDHDCEARVWGPTYITVEWKGLARHRRRS
jgi:hypothetical protein